MLKKLLILIVVMMLGGTILIQTATGKEFPTKPIEIICPYTPGSSIDLMSRLVADIAPKFLGQPVVVNNKPGGAGSIAAADVISSKPDGYKLATMTSFYFAATAKTQKLPFDPDDLVPIANFMEFKFGVTVKGDSPWKTLGDLLEYARKNPGKLKWGHPGRAISIYMSALLIFRKAGVETLDVPYKGSPQVLAALLGGHIDAATSVYGTVKDHVKTGKVRYLTVYSDRRYSDLPDVPSVVELGFPEAAIPSFVGFYAHKDTPENIKKTLFDAFKKTYEDPEFKKGIEKLGEEPRFGGPELMREAIRKSAEVGVPILKEFGLYVGK
jgi:tripartite-type tricarboxylate transporter receptor subunit TctC